MPPSWFIPFMPQWQTISQSSSMMNRFTHSTHDETFHPCYKWQTISPMLPITNHCTNVIYEKNPPVPCCHKKPLQSCPHHKLFHPSYLWQIILHFAIHTTTYYPHSTHEKKHYTHVPMTNHCNYAIIRNPFSHTTISPILPWQITSTMPLMTNHFTSSIPGNHGSYSTRKNHFIHSIDDISFIRN